MEYTHTYIPSWYEDSTIYQTDNDNESKHCTHHLANLRITVSIKHTVTFGTRVSKE